MTMGDYGLALVRWKVKWRLAWQAGWTATAAHVQGLGRFREGCQGLVPLEAFGVLLRAQCVLRRFGFGMGLFGSVLVLVVYIPTRVASLLLPGVLPLRDEGASSTTFTNQLGEHGPRCRCS